MSEVLAALVSRSADLKQQVFEFARHPRFDRVFRQEVRARFGRVVVDDEREIENFYDWFIQQHRLHDGRTIVDRFLEARTDLTGPEREFLAGWRDVREGPFEVMGRDGDVLLTENLIDDLAYRIHTNAGATIFDRMPRGSFLVTRVVPVLGEWLISGVSQLYPAAERDVVYAAAASVAAQRPELTFHNPRLLARGWELHRAQREAFVRLFGVDEVTVAADMTIKLLLEFYRSLGAADSFVAPDDGWSNGAAETVGIIFDAQRGLGTYVDYALVQAAFADPDLMRGRRHKEAVKSYFLDESVDPVPLERLAGRHPDTVTVVIRAVFGKPGLTWERDGERLLRQYKRPWYERTVLPAVSVLNDRLAPFL